MKIELNEQQARVVTVALDAYSRLQMGQLKILRDVLVECKDGSGDDIDRDTLELKIADMTMSVFGYPINASHGIHSPHVPERAQIA